MKQYCLILLMTVYACSANQTGDTIQSVELKDDKVHAVSFQDFVENIPEYQFPVKMTCSYERMANPKDFEEYSQYFPAGGRVVSKLKSPFNCDLIIFDFACDYSCPVLYSYNENGVRIDSVNLTPGQCAEDSFGKRRNWFLIDENLEIELVDSMEYFSTDNKLDSITVETVMLKLNRSGKFDSISRNIQSIPFND